MILEPTPIVLFCGLGSHAKAVYHFMRSYAVRKIYIVLSKRNLPDYEILLSRLRQEITQKIREERPEIELRFLSVPHGNFYKSFTTLVDAFLLERTNHLIVDLTGGRKIVSFIMNSAYSYCLRSFTEESKLVFFHREEAVETELPPLRRELLDTKLETFLGRVFFYQQAVVKNRTLTAYLIGRGELPDHPLTNFTPPYSESTSHRYRAELRKKKYLDKQGRLTLLGRMYLYTVFPFN